MLAAAPSFLLALTRGTSTPRNILGVTRMGKRWRERTQREEIAVGNKAHTCWRGIPRRWQPRELVCITSPASAGLRQGTRVAFPFSSIIIFSYLFFFLFCVAVKHP